MKRTTQITLIVGGLLAAGTVGYMVQPHKEPVEFVNPSSAVDTATAEKRAPPNPPVTRSFVSGFWLQDSCDDENHSFHFIEDGQYRGLGGQGQWTLSGNQLRVSAYEIDDDLTKGPTVSITYEVTPNGLNRMSLLGESEGYRLVRCADTPRGYNG